MALSLVPILHRSVRKNHTSFKFCWIILVFYMVNKILLHCESVAKFVEAHLVALDPPALGSNGDVSELLLAQQTHEHTQQVVLNRHTSRYSQHTHYIHMISYKIKNWCGSSLVVMQIQILDPHWPSYGTNPDPSGSGYG